MNFKDMQREHKEQLTLQEKKGLKGWKYADLSYTLEMIL